MKQHAFAVLVALSALHMSVQAGFTSSYVLGVPTSASAGALLGAHLHHDQKRAEQDKRANQVQVPSWRVQSLKVEQGEKTVPTHVLSGDKGAHFGVGYNDMYVQVDLSPRQKVRLQYVWHKSWGSEWVDKEQWNSMPAFESVQQMEQTAEPLAQGTSGYGQVSKVHVRIGEQLYELPALAVWGLNSAQTGVQFKQDRAGVELQNKGDKDQKLLLTMDRKELLGGFVAKAYTQEQIDQIQQQRAQRQDQMLLAISIIITGVTGSFLYVRRKNAQAQKERQQQEDNTDLWQEYKASKGFKR